MRRNRLLDGGWLTSLPRFQGARPDHVRVESSSRCFPSELLNFVRPRELVSFDARHVTRSPLIEKRIWVGRYNKNDY